MHAAGKEKNMRLYGVLHNAENFSKETYLSLTRGCAT